MKKIVLTGGPCCGKTTLANELKKKGFCVVDESAREFISRNRTVNTEERQKEIFLRQLEKENLSRDELVILDRCLIDSLAYCKVYLGYVPELMKQDFSKKYSQVFILERFPFEADGLRVESGENEAEKIHQTIISEYKKHGYNPITVPKMELNERVKFILSCIGGAKWT